jgi:hypothetical protein
MRARRYGATQIIDDWEELAGEIRDRVLTRLVLRSLGAAPRILYLG